MTLQTSLLMTHCVCVCLCFCVRVASSEIINSDLIGRFGWLTVSQPAVYVRVTDWWTCLTMRAARVRMLLDFDLKCVIFQDAASQML